MYSSMQSQWTRRRCNKEIERPNYNIFNNLIETKLIKADIAVYFIQTWDPLSEIPTSDPAIANAMILIAFGKFSNFAKICNRKM
jgi:hypothetical protein